jgi:hypothetical protein
VGLASLFFRFLAGLLGLGDLGDSDVELLVEPEGKGLVIVVDDLVAVIVNGEVQVSTRLVWMSRVWKDGDGRGGSRSMLAKTLLLMLQVGDDRSTKVGGGRRGR